MQSVAGKAGSERWGLHSTSGSKNALKCQSQAVSFCYRLIRGSANTGDLKIKWLWGRGQCCLLLCSKKCVHLALSRRDVKVLTCTSQFFTKSENYMRLLSLSQVIALNLLGAQKKNLASSLFKFGNHTVCPSDSQGSQKSVGCIWNWFNDGFGIME